MIFISDPDGLAEIKSFVQCIVNHEGQEDKVILVLVSLFISHPCKAWFGWPTEVWSDMHSSQEIYIPLQKISSLAVYTRAEVDFGRRIGKQRVLVVIPMKGRNDWPWQ